MQFTIAFLHEFLIQLEQGGELIQYIFERGSEECASSARNGKTKVVRKYACGMHFILKRGGSKCLKK